MFNNKNMKKSMLKAKVKKKKTRRRKYADLRK